VEAGEPLLSLFASNLVELPDGPAQHVPGATASLLASGAIVPPPWAKFVLSIYFMNPSPPAAGKGERQLCHALLCHFATSTTPDAATGPSAELLRELWQGDAVSSLSRLKVISRLHSGPNVLKTALAWARVDASRPFLAARQVNSSMHRTTISPPSSSSSSSSASSASSSSSAATSSSSSSSPSVPPSSPQHVVQHVEVGLDVQAHWLPCVVYRAAFSAVSSVDVSLTFVLEGRAPEELPERALAVCTLRHLDPTDGAYPPHRAWPSSASAVPGSGMRIYPKDINARLRRRSGPAPTRAASLDDLPALNKVAEVEKADTDATSESSFES
jgi:hypothetical protein